jgi:hypothetical protein
MLARLNVLRADLRVTDRAEPAGAWTLTLNYPQLVRTKNI